jgi:hypothetical protein
VSKGIVAVFRYSYFDVDQHNTKKCLGPLNIKAVINREFNSEVHHSLN